MKTILASLTGYGNDKTTLETALAVGRQFSAHVDCFFVRPEFPSSKELARSGVFARQTLLSERLREIDRESAERMTKAKQAYEHAIAVYKPVVGSDPASPSKGSISWSESVGTDIPDTISEGRLHELIVLGRESVHDVVEVDRTGSIALGCGRPVLLSPSVSRAEFGRNIAIAWKDKAEAARALTAAAPFLERANNITVITVAEDIENEAATKASGERLTNQMKWNGYAVEAKHVPSSFHPASLSLLNEAYACSADMLIMGAYGHNRFREIVFGGVTRDIINECALPVLLFH